MLFQIIHLADFSEVPIMQELCLSDLNNQYEHGDMSVRRSPARHSSGVFERPKQFKNHLLLEYVLFAIIKQNFMAIFSQQ